MTNLFIGKLSASGLTTSSDPYQNQMLFLLSDENNYKDIIDNSFKDL